ncbi:MAG: hypothetical protein HY043_06830 [Verrucomicrobia bacterium]|nr:hypothetical protein [Verrucomicrobiota bacterium]
MHLIFLALFFFLSTFSTFSDVVISGFAAGQNPFGSIFVSISANNDGTQTLLAPSSSDIAWVATENFFPGIVDFSEGGTNNAISLRARLEPDHTDNGAIALQFNYPPRTSGRPAESVGTSIPFGLFNAQDFTTITIPLSDFQGTITPPALDSVISVFLHNVPSEPGHIVHITFDSLTAVSIPEPGTVSLGIVGFVTLLLARYTRRL